MATNKSLYFDNLGDDFEKFMDDYDVSRRCDLIFKHLLNGISLKNRKVLEVGCGTGRISQEIIAREAKLTVLDIGEQLVSKVAEQNDCRGVVGDACCLPFDDHSFDIVISSECIEHTDNPDMAVRQMCRVCSSKGFVCLTSPNKLWYPALWTSLKLKIRKFKGVENWLFPWQTRRIMKDENFKNIRMSGCHLWPFQFTFTRPFLSRIDEVLGSRLYPVMINYGICGEKEAS